MDFDKVRALGEEGLVDNLDHISFVNIWKVSCNYLRFIDVDSLDSRH